MGDHVHPQRGIAVIAPDRIDQAIEPASRLDIVLAPVVGVDVVTALAGAGRVADRAADVFPVITQRRDKPAVEILSQRGVGNVERLEIVGPQRQRFAIEVEREAPVVVEQVSCARFRAKPPPRSSDHAALTRIRRE